MALDWILEHWQLLTAVLLALVNFLHTFVVHNGSKRRLSDLEKNENGFSTSLSALLGSTKAILEALNEKESK